MKGYKGVTLTQKQKQEFKQEESQSGKYNAILLLSSIVGYEPLVTNALRYLDTPQEQNHYSKLVNKYI